MIENVQLILGIFLVFYILIICYDLFMQVKIKNTNKTIKNKKQEISAILKHKKDIQQTELIKYLSNIENLKIFNEEKDKIEHRIKCDLKVLFSSLSNVYITRDSIERAYFAYSIKTWQLMSANIENYLDTVMNQNSIYGIEMSLEAFYESKDSQKIMNALLILNANQANYNAKLLTDGLLLFHGNTSELGDLIASSWDTFSIEMQIGFINYFRYVNYDMSDMLFNELKKNEDKEKTIAITRYFSKIHNEDVKEYLMTMMADHKYRDFEYMVVTIQTLANYEDKKIDKIMIDYLTDSNYYVRFNCAKALNKRMDITTIKINDSYGQEVLNYVHKEGRDKR